MIGMKLEELKQHSALLQREADKVVSDLNFIERLSQLGRVKRVGSSVTGLLLDEDIDFKIYTDHPDGGKVAALAAELLQSELAVVGIKVTDFDKAKKGRYKLTGVYLGFVVLTNRSWNIDVIVRKESETPPDERELSALLEVMTEEQRDTILLLKSELMDRKRYAALPKHPLVFNSMDVYIGVLKGGVKTVGQLEEYCKKFDS
jgi:hypothetical protein